MGAAENGPVLSPKDRPASVSCLHSSLAKRCVAPIPAISKQLARRVAEKVKTPAQHNTTQRRRADAYSVSAPLASMAWWEGVEETRILIAPAVAEPTPKEIGEKGRLLTLRHPKTGSSTRYFLNNGTLHELNWFKQSYGSWFLGEYVCQDGGLYTATPVDPVFILLPIFEVARMKKEGDQGKFRQLDEMMFINGYPEYQNLLSIAEESMQIVCEVKEIGSSKFFRLNDSKVLAWLCHKVHQLKLTLPTLDKNYAAQYEKDMLREVVSMLGEYLKDEPWVKLLCNHLKLDLQEAAKRTMVQEFLPCAPNSTSGSSNSLQSKTASQKKTPGKQAKKMKTETDSRNIRDMFTRASRRGS